LTLESRMFLTPPKKTAHAHERELQEGESCQQSPQSASHFVPNGL
jgi:hypothetical protein